MTQWVPSSSWNSIFSAEERQKGSNLFQSIVSLHTQGGLPLTERAAETIVMMKMIQEKYPGLRYSDDQERILRQYPVFPREQRPLQESLVLREKHERQHGHKKENGLNHHPRHGERPTGGYKRDGGTKEALKDPRRFGIRK